MGQVLGFAHCKESPSTASTTPDSTDGANDESDFPELQTAREFSEEEEEEGSVEWGTPRELTFSYITIATPSGGSPSAAEHRGRRDSQTRRTRAPLPRAETCETLLSALGDSLESIPSLCPSPEAEGGPPSGGGGPDGPGGLPLGWGGERDAAGGEERVSPCPTPPLPVAETDGGGSTACSGTDDPGAGPPCCGADAPRDPALTPPEEEEEEEEGPGQEPRPEQLHVEKGRPEEGIAAVLVADLVYWRDTRTSALAFTALMVALLCLMHFSIVSVASYLSLAALGATVSLRGYSKVLQLVRRGDGRHPFQAQLDADFGLSKEQLERLTERVAHHVTWGTKALQRLFLVDDMVESLKFAFLFYVLTYVGAVFNGLTLLILGVISAFTFPLLYRQHQAQIDQYVGLVRNQLSNLRAKMLAKLPTAKAKAE